MNQIRIPAGYKDLIQEEAMKKKELEERFTKIFTSYGYTPIFTPALEYAKTYNLAFSTFEEGQMYKFIDEKGDILGLRMDMTVPIARVAASKFKESDRPLRFAYCSNVYKVRAPFAGKRCEVSDCGIELMGAGMQSHLEVLCAAFECMQALQTDTYTLEIGSSAFYQRAAQAAGLSNEEASQLALLIDNKSMVDLKAFLSDLSLEEKAALFFEKLPFLAGNASVLDEALSYCFDDELNQIIYELKELYEKLCALGYKEHVGFDLGKVPHLDYYTGIIFEGFVGGVGSSILSGGRYDRLLEKFGTPMDACGFSIKLDALLDVVSLTKSKPRIRLYYPAYRIVEALQKAKELRKEAIVELIEYDQDALKEELV
jgi:ATP phosphoribosyltransferase regulatory subunit